MQATLDAHLQKKDSQENEKKTEKNNAFIEFLFKQKPCTWITFALKDYYLTHLDEIITPSGRINEDPMKVVPFARKYFESWRPYQRETIEKIVKAFESNKPFVFLNAPTGSGKSLIGMAVASVFLVNELKYRAATQDSIKILKPLPQVVYTTENTTLQQQIAKEFYVPVIMGRKNYPCQHLQEEGDSEATAKDCPYQHSSTACPIVGDLVSAYREYLKAEGETEDLPRSIFDVNWKFMCHLWGENPRGRCEYIFWRELARASPIAVLNHHYTYGALVLNPVLHQHWPEIGLLIIDEAHKFPEFLVKTFSKELNLTETIGDMKDGVKALERGIQSLKKWADERLSRDPSETFPKKVKGLLEQLEKAIKSLEEEPLLKKGRFKVLKDDPQIGSLIGDFVNYAKAQSPSLQDEVEVLLTGEGIRVLKDFLKDASLIVDFTVGIERLAQMLFDETSKKISGLLGVSQVEGRTTWAELAELLRNLAENPGKLDDYSKTHIYELFDKAVTLTKYGGHVLDADYLIGLRQFIMGLKTLHHQVVKLTGLKGFILQNESYLLKPIAKSGNVYFIPPDRDFEVSPEDKENKEYILTLKAKWGAGGLNIYVNLKVIFPKKVFRRVWKQLGKPRILFMSATLLPELLAEELGIRPEEYEYIKVPSIFPKENRPILFVGAGNASRKNLRDEDFVKGYIKVLDEFLDLVDGERGLILITSKGDYFTLKKHSRHKKRFMPVWGSANEKTEKINQHGITESSIIVSPSMWEGANLTDDLSRFQIIFKVPFPDRSDVSTVVRSVLNRDWYYLATLNTIVQGVGRSVRSEEDWAVTVILDSSFWRLYKRYQKTIPDWFDEALVPLISKKPSERVELAKNFIQSFLKKKRGKQFTS